jgi:hypothetical protein
MASDLKDTRQDMTDAPKTLFAQELAKHPEAVAELSDATYWRYSNNMFPKAVQWLRRHPRLLRALLADAERDCKNESDN